MPHHRQGENCPAAPVRARGRSWGEWLENTDSGVASYALHGNVTGFSAFAHTARGPGESPENTLRAEYEISDPDNHMNRAANLACAAMIRRLVNEFEPSSCVPIPAARLCDLVIVPNPVIRDASIRYSSWKKGDRVGIYDMTGRIVARLTVTEPDETLIWNLDTVTGEQAGSGSYVVKSNGRGGSTGRLVVR